MFKVSDELVHKFLYWDGTINGWRCSFLGIDRMEVRKGDCIKEFFSKVRDDNWVMDCYNQFIAFLEKELQNGD